MRILPICAALAACLPAHAAVAGAGACGMYEAVEPGDSLETISRRCEVDMDTLYHLNPGLSDLVPAMIVVLSTEMDEVPSAGGGWAAIVGDYAPGGTCIGAERIVSIDFDTISFGETRCAIATRYPGEGRTGLELDSCFSEGEPVEPRSALLDWRPSEITLTMAQRQWVLERCTDM